jgi:hypothetical protein
VKNPKLPCEACHYIRPFRKPGLAERLIFFDDRRGIDDGDGHIHAQLLKKFTDIERRPTAEKVHVGAAGKSAAGIALREGRRANRQKGVFRS